MTINELGKVSAEIEKEKGWLEEERSPLEIAALVHSEISEFVEDYRDAKSYVGGWELSPLTKKPQGPATEMADAIIRILGYCHRQGWDMDAVIAAKTAFNRTRPYRHGNKKF